MNTVCLQFNAKHHSSVRWFWTHVLVVCLASCTAALSKEVPYQEPTDSGTATEDSGTPGKPDDCGQETPCAAKRINDAGQCMVSIATDGTACSDGNHCTLDARCAAGLCQGQPSTSVGQTLGTFRSFGASPTERAGPSLEGLASFVSDDHILFGEGLGAGGLSLSLVQVTPAGLVRLDHRQLDIDVSRFSASPRDWTDRFTTFFVPLGSQRVVLVATGQRLELMEIKDQRISTVSTYPLVSPESIGAGVGREDRFWTCAGLQVAAWQIGAAGQITPVAEAPFIALPSGTCRSLALSNDGQTLWVATVRGLVAIDVSLPAKPTLKRVLFSGQSFAYLQIAGAYLGAQELEPSGGLGRIFVFRATDMSQDTLPTALETFGPLADAAASQWTYPLGFTLLDGEMLVQWFHQKNERRSLVLRRYLVSGSGVSAPKSTLPIREADEWNLHLSAVQLVSGKRLAVLQPWRRVVELDELGPMRFRTGLFHGSLESIHVREDGQVLALGPFESHVIDMQQLSASRGGMLHSVDTRRLRLAPSAAASGKLHLVTIPLRSTTPNVYQQGDTAVFSCLRPSADGNLEPQGELRIAGGLDMPEQSTPAALATSQGQLFQVSPTASGDFRIRRFELPNDCSGGTLAPADERTLKVGPAATGLRNGWGFAVDQERLAWLIGEVRTQASQAPSKALLHWSSSDDALRATFAIDDAIEISGLALAGDKALMVERGRYVYLLQRSGPSVSLVKRVDLSAFALPLEARRLLWFDGAIAYLSVVYRENGKVLFGVVALSADDLSERFLYPTPKEARSLGTSAGRLFFGMNDAVTVATPACRVP